MTLDAFRKQFEPLFEARLRSACSSANALVADPFLGRIITHVATIALAGGKRIRPYMAWLMFQGRSGHADVLDMLTALELFHLFALVHDDVMDRGTVRHGLPTVHQAAELGMRQDHRRGDVPHAAEGQAILAGDLLFAWSQEAFYAASGVPADARHHAAPFFRSMIEEVIAGQMIDVDLTSRPNPATALIERKMYLKTSSYTFIRPLQIGAALAGETSQTTRDWCERFGASLGRAFQIQDDLLDLAATDTGKTPFADLQEGQQTLLTQWIHERGTSAQRDELAMLMGTAPTEDDRPRIMALFDGSGALAHARSEWDGSLDEALRLLQAADLSPQAVEAFRVFVEGIRRREA